MDDLKKVILGAVLLLVFALVITLKLGGASIIADPSIVEKIGFCKNIHGETFHLKEPHNLCYEWGNSSNNQTFTDIEFREACPKHKLLSWRLFSDCFRDGGSRFSN